MAATTQEQLLSDILPKVIIEKITISNTASDTLKVSLNLLVRETLDNDLFGTWFDSIDLKKYIIIQVVQSTLPEVTKALSFSNDMIQIANVARQLDLRKPSTQVLAYFKQTKDVEQLTDILRTKTKRVTISLSPNNDTEKTSISNYSSYVDNNGNTIYDITRTVDFEITDSQPQHLSYFVVASIDLDAISKDYGISYDVMESIEENGKVFCETVLDNGEIIATSFIYVTKNGETWDGPVHQNKDGTWKTGDEETPDSIELIQTAVANTKIEDFRNVKRIERYVFDFNEGNSLNEILDSVNSINKSFVFARKTSYFSDLNISSTPDGDRRMMVAIDFQKLMLENSPFYRLFRRRNPNFKREALSKSKILNFKLLRRRVKNQILQSNKSADVELQPFDNNEPEIIIAQSKDTSWENFIATENSIGALREIDFENEEQNEFIRLFTGMDKEMSDISDGLYQYGIEIELYDGTSEFIQDRLNQLQLAKIQLETYFNEASIPSMKKFYADSRNPHIKSPSVFSTNTQTSAGTYDPISNKFTKQYIDSLYKKYGAANQDSVNPSAPWTACVSIYIEVLKLFSSIDNKNAEELRLSLFKYLYPESANPSSILKTIELYDYLIQSITKLTGVKAVLNVGSVSSNAQIDSSGAVGSKSLSTIKVSKYFNNVVDSNLIRTVSYDYLGLDSSSPTNTNGLATLNIVEYVQRINNETLKYFNNEKPKLDISFNGKNVTSADSVDNTSFGFLTPTRIDFPNRSVMLSQLPPAQQRARKIRNIEYLHDDQKDNHTKALELQASMLTFKLANNRAPYLSHPTKLADISEKENQLIEKLTDLLSEHGNVIIDRIELEKQKDVDGKFRTIIKDVQSNINKSINNISTVDVEDIQKTKRQKLNSDNDNAGITNFLVSLSSPMVRNKTINKNTVVAQSNKKNLSIFSKQPKKQAAITFTKDLAKIDTTKINSSSIKTVGSRPVETVPTIHGFKKPLSESHLKSLPNHVKSIIGKSPDIKPNIAGNLKFDNISDTIKNQSLNYLNFETIMKVEYLAGFEMVYGIPNLQKPIWKILDKKVIDKASEKTELVCRMTSYENEVFQIEHNKHLEDSAYDRHFIINLRNKSKIKDLPQIQKPTNLFIDRMINGLKEQLPGLTIKEKFNDIKNINRNIVPELIEIVKTDKNNNKTVISMDLRNIPTTDLAAAKLKNDVKIVGKATVAVSSEELAKTMSLHIQNRNISSSSMSNTHVSSRTLGQIKSNPRRGLNK